MIKNHSVHCWVIEKLLITFLIELLYFLDYIMYPYMHNTTFYTFFKIHSYISHMLFQMTNIYIFFRPMSQINVRY